jgi:hypothetical protein
MVKQDPAQTFRSTNRSPRQFGVIASAAPGIYPLGRSGFCHSQWFPMVGAKRAPDAATDGLVGTVMGLMAMARGRATRDTLQRIAAVAMGSLHAG